MFAVYPLFQRFIMLASAADVRHVPGCFVSVSLAAQQPPWGRYVRYHGLFASYLTSSHCPQNKSAAIGFPRCKVSPTLQRCGREQRRGVKGDLRGLMSSSYCGPWDLSEQRGNHSGLGSWGMRSKHRQEKKIIERRHVCTKG